MTKTEARELIAEYEANPDASASCDNLCAVLDALPGQPEGEFSADEVREMVENSTLPEADEEACEVDPHEERA